MIDIHSHVLPGIDDGAMELGEAVAMCRQALAAGCEALIATPHQRYPTSWNAKPRELEALLDRLQSEIGDRLDLYLGAEIRLDAGLLKSIDRLTASGFLSLAGSSYLLVEFARRWVGLDPVAAIRDLCSAGWRPIVAHPEFVPGLCEDVALAERLVEAGALLQITSTSVTGDFGERALRCVVALLDAGLAHFVASDAHDTAGRPPGLQRAERAIAARCGGEVARRLTVDNPRAVIEHRPIGARPLSGEPLDGRGSVPEVRS